MLNIKHLNCQRHHRQLLQLEQMTVSSGELFGIVGPNGAGKSTLIKIIAGDYQTEGELLFHGKPLSAWPATQRARHIAVLPQASQLNFTFLAEEVVALGLTPLTLNRAAAKTAIRHFMQQTDCWHLASRAYPNLSGGERQRVQLARVLLQLSQAEQPPLLLLDEPTSAQDLGQQHRLMQLASDLAKQQAFSVMAVIHDLNQALQYCDRVGLLANGKLISTDKPAAVLQQASIEKYWGYQASLIEWQGRQLVV